jgi:KTSC domain
MKTMKMRLGLIVFVIWLSCPGGPAASLPEDDSLTSHIPRQKVASKNLASVGYSKRRHVLEIEFVNGSVYRYLNVAPSVYRDLLVAESKTGYYDSNIKRNYRSVRVRPRVKDPPHN